jgi:FkbM family methyltransferase
MSFDQVRQTLLEELAIDLVIDVGANAGQYATRVRAAGYRGSIVSLEPLHDAYQQLLEAAETDPLWATHNLAAGPTVAETVIHVAGNSYSSSLLPMAERHVQAAPESVYVTDQRIGMVTLDSMGLIEDEDRAMLKMDTQGSELQVLAGASHTLGQVEIVETEMELVPLYVGQPLATDVCVVLRDAGFVPVALDVAFADPTTGELLALDGLFRRVAS